MIKKNKLIKEALKKGKDVEHDASLSAQVIERQKI